jgi:hypothetical protein
MEAAPKVSEGAGPSPGPNEVLLKDASSLLKVISLAGQDGKSLYESAC